MKSTVLCDTCRLGDRNKRRDRTAQERANRPPKVKKEKAQKEKAENKKYPHKYYPKKRKGPNDCRVCGKKTSNAHCKYCEGHRYSLCVYCGRKFSMRSSRGRSGKYCSTRCTGRALSGMRYELARNWRGGKSEESQLIRGRMEYKEWRHAVFSRDNWTCQDCGKRGGQTINAHHIKEFAKHVDLRFEVSNGITLCEPCHQKRHMSQEGKRANARRRKLANSSDRLRPRDA